VAAALIQFPWKNKQSKRLHTGYSIERQLVNQAVNL